MFLSQLNDENQSDVIRDFMKLTAQNLPEKPVYADTENIILLYNQKTDTFWELSVSSMKNGLYAHAEKMDNICTFWELIRKVYGSEQKGLVYRRNGAKAFVYNMETFHECHPYTAKEIILWDSEQMDHLLMKYDRDVVDVSFAIQYLKYPQIEKLYKAGFERIILNWVLRDRYTAKEISQFEKCFKDAKTINQITSLAKGQWSQLITFRLDLNEWAWLREILSVYKVDDVNVAPLVRMMIRGEDSFRKSFNKIVRCTNSGRPAYDADQLIRDLINDHGNTQMPSHRACIYLADYIRLCEKNGMEPVYRSEHLTEEHDMMVIVAQEKKQQKNDEETQKIYDRRYRELSRYLYESDELAVILPMRFSDLIYEGRNNHNCVGSLYVSRYQNGSSNIFFIREKKNPLKSYITVELNQSCEKTIQAFYSYNRRITDKRDLKFISEWLASNKRVNQYGTQNLMNPDIHGL